MPRIVGRGVRGQTGGDMGTDRTEDIDALLVHAEQAHGKYETTELNGVYDQDWATWYAAFAVEHGIGKLLGHEVTADRLAQFLASSNLEFTQIDPSPSESWATYAARRITAEL